MLINTAVAVAVALWFQLAGVTAPPIQVHEGHLGYATAAAAPAAGHCDLFVSDTWHTYSAEIQQTFVTHEVGHCLGVWDHVGSGIMSGALVPVFTATDIFAVQNANGVRTNRAFAVFP